MTWCTCSECTYGYPVITEDSRNLNELADLFLPGYEDIPFTSSEEEMLPIDSNRF